MCSQTRNSCAKAFDNRSRSKNLKPKKLRGGQIVNPPTSPRLLGLTLDKVTRRHKDDGRTLLIHFHHLIYTIDFIFGTNHLLLLFFQLRETKRCLNRFNGNNNYKITSQALFCNRSSNMPSRIKVGIFRTRRSNDVQQMQFYSGHTSRFF